MNSEVIEYHQMSKHSFAGHAPGPGYMDWQNQPDPFRRYAGAKVVPLLLRATEEGPDYESALRGTLSPAPLGAAFLSQLLQDSLGLSAWKVYGNSTWALRMNPSSGNLHPTEAYVISGPVPELSPRGFVAHYAPREHALEIRAEFSVDQEPDNWPLLIGLSSITWREAWKYGERAFRYCHHDIGHAIASISVAAAGLGWQCRLVDGVSSRAIQKALHLDHNEAVEAETADCLLQLTPGKETPLTFDLSLLESFVFSGEANRLSRETKQWPGIEKMVAVTEKPYSEMPASKPLALLLPEHPRDISLRKIIHQRRSAVAMDGVGTMTQTDFFSILERVMPQKNRSPLETLGREPFVHLLFFVHRVEGVAPGLYLLIRNADDENELREKTRPEFLWTRAESAPAAVPLYQLVKGDVKAGSQSVSCGQEIAAEGCFSLGMVTRFAEPLKKEGPWMYPRFFWECGLVGQILYLEAEALGFRATGIGCFFDDPVHDILGLNDLSYQTLYHFTVGCPVEDLRLGTLPPYSDQWRDKKGFGSV